MAEIAASDEHKKSPPLRPDDHVEVFRDGHLIMVGTVRAIDMTISKTDRSTRVTIANDQLELT